MVHRGSDSRLLTNLLSAEKEYIKALSSLLSASHASHASLSAYAAASPPSTSSAISAFARTLGSGDEALRTYARAVEVWIEGMKELKDLEDEVGEVMRDREILVTRLIKASKAKPTVEVTHANTSSAFSPSSSSSNLAPPGPTHPKLLAAQAELQGCEAHLHLKESGLNIKRAEVLSNGFASRARAMAQCGRIWDRAGEEGVRIFEENSDGLSSAISLPGSEKPLPDPVVIMNSPRHEPMRRSSDVSSVTPSQSASQIALNETLHSSPAAHLATKPHPLSRRITEESLRNLAEGSSSDSDSQTNNFQVVENERYRNASKVALKQPIAIGDDSETEGDVGTPARKYTIPTSKSDTSPKKKLGFFGSFRGLFKPNQPDHMTSTVPTSLSYQDSNRALVRRSLFANGRSEWATRVDQNVRNAKKRRNDGDSSDDEQNDDTRMEVMSDIGPARSIPVLNRAQKKLNKPKSTVPVQDGDRAAEWATDAQTPSRSKPRGKKDVAAGDQPENPSAHITIHAVVNSNSSRGVARSNSVTSALSAASAPAATRRSSTKSRRATTRANTLGNSSVTDVGAPANTSTQKVIAHNIQPSSSASNPPGQGPRQGQSLMSIVEDVARIRAHSIDGSKHASTPVGLIAVPKAPARMTRAHLDEIGSSPTNVSSAKSSNRRALSFDATISKTPGPLFTSTLTLPTTPPSVLENGNSKLGNLSPPKPTSPSPSPTHTPPARDASPLRSALRGSSPIPILLSPPSAPSLSRNQSTDSRTSASSYETVRENLSAESDADTETVMENPPPLIQIGPPTPAKDPLRQRVDSTTSNSTATGATTTKRKSVRVSLMPSYSATPPAIDDQDSHAPWSSPKPLARENGHARAAREKAQPTDVWEDSSEEDEEYQRARRLLTSAGKKKAASDYH